MSVDEVTEKEYNLSFPNGKEVDLQIINDKYNERKTREIHYTDGRRISTITYSIGFEPEEHFEELKQKYDDKFDIEVYGAPQRYDI